MITWYPRHLDTWLLDIRSYRVQAKASHLEIEPSTGETKHASGLRDVASRPVQGGRAHVALDLLDGRGEVAGLDRARRGAYGSEIP